MRGQVADVAADPTVCAASEKAQIECYTGFSLRDAEPAALKFVVERSKQAGNEAFRQRNYQEAIKLYSQAIAGDETDHTLYGNRSAAYLAVGLYEQALWEARKAIALRSDWAKGHYRLGCAHSALGQWAAAAAALQRGLEAAPNAADVACKLAHAQARLREEEQARAAAAATERRSLVLKLRAARREDQKLAALNQFKQSMAAPDWELEDLEWRPTWLPGMRLRPLDPADFSADPRRRLLLSFVNSLADLAHPKAALRTLSDGPRLAAFQLGIRAALARRPAAHVLVLGSGGGVLGLAAAAAGAARVTAVERGRMLYRMAKQVMEANAQLPGAGRVHLLDRGLRAVGVDSEPPPPEVAQARRQRRRQRRRDAELAALQRRHVAQTGTAAPAASSSSPSPPGSNPDRVPASASPALGQVAGKERGAAEPGAGSAELASETAPDGRIAGSPPPPLPPEDEEAEADDLGARLPSRADALVIDLLDHSVLGMGLLPALDDAARRLLAPAAAVVPRAVRVYAQLIELRLGPVAGFDLSAMDAYRWYPGTERVELERVSHRRLSAPFEVRTLDLEARVAKVQAAWANEARERRARGSCGEDDSSDDNSGGEEGAARARPDGEWEFDAELEVEVVDAGLWNAVAFWFDLTMGGEDGGEQQRAVVSSYGGGSGGGEVAEGASWGQAVQYIDGVEVARGATALVRARHDTGQLVFTSSPPQCRPHHAIVPRWHYDMVLDAQRNDAYQGAIARAVARKRDALGRSRELLALDMGAGSGLLAMMAARAGADAVYAAEVSAHMCDVGEECTLGNGFLGRVTMLDRDVRRMDVLRKPDGTAPEMPRRADLAVYEVFDSGLIGEGVLHLLAAARAKLLTPDAALVPAGAVVYCQPVEMRIERALGVDVRQANRWRWRPDYEGLDLARCRNQWTPLADPIRAFSFDFYEAAANMRPAEALLDVAFTRAGVFNAVVVWFELFLDEEASLSTSPYADKGPTWQQAVQWVREVEVGGPGEALVLTARHDTYSISFEVEEGRNGGGEALGRRYTDVPLQDPAWRTAHDALQELNSQLVRACVQSPLEYRATAQAAVALAARAHDVGADAQQAAEFCTKMMG